MKHYACPTCGVQPSKSGTCQCGLTRDQVDENVFYQETIDYITMLTTTDPDRNYRWYYLDYLIQHAFMVRARGRLTPYHRGCLRAHSDWMDRIHRTVFGEAPPEDQVPVPKDYPFFDYV